MDEENEESNVNTHNNSKTKRKVKKMIIKALIKVLPFFLIILFTFAVFGVIAEKVEEVIDGIVNFFTIKERVNDDGSIKIDDENQTDQIIKALEEMGIDAEDLYVLGDVDYDAEDLEKEKLEASRKYIRKFYEAQMTTQTLYYNKGSKKDKTYGCIYVYRTDDESLENKKLLTYMDYEKMEGYAKDGNVDEIKDYFSLNDEGQLMLPSWTTTTNSEKKALGYKNNSETTVYLKPVDYLNAVSQYTTQMNFFVYLAVIAQNPEFVSAVTDLVKNSRIEITVLEEKNVNVRTEEYSYTENTKGSTIMHYQGEETTIPVENSTDKKQTTITTTTTITPSPKITYAKTWFSEQTITYSKKTEITTSELPVRNASNDDSLKDDPQPTNIPEGETATWTTNRSITGNIKTTTTTYEEDLRGEVISKLGEKGSKGIEDKNNNEKVDGNKFGDTEWIDEETTFIGLLDNNFKIPNSKRYEAAGKTNIVSGAEWLFYMMQKDPRLQNMEQMMRYALYLYTGKDYGVTSFDFQIFDAKDFKKISGTSNQLLIELIHSYEGTPKKNADGTKYIVTDDGAGHPTVGWGVDIFNSGYSSEFIAAGYSTEMGAEIDVEFVDAIEKRIIESKIATAESLTAGLNLTGYQINALVSRMYNCGEGGIIDKRGTPALNFVDSYKKYWNEETDDYFKKQNNNANFSHNLYVQYMSKPVTSDGEYLPGLETRRKSEWTLFQTGYYDRLDKWHSNAGDLLEMADKVHNDERNWTYSLDGNLLYGGNIEKSLNNPNRVTCCATYVSCVLYAAGYVEEAQINRYAYNGCEDLYRCLTDLGWEIITSPQEIEGGDVVFFDWDGSKSMSNVDHVEIYAGDDTWYGAGDTSKIQGVAPFYSSGRKNFMILAMRPK